MSRLENQTCDGKRNTAEEKEDQGRVHREVYSEGASGEKKNESLEVRERKWLVFPDQETLFYLFFIL